MAYLGNAPVVGDSTNSFRLLDDIASFTLTFDATDTAVVSIANDTLSFTNHRFVNGQKVTYTDGGGTAIGGLSDGTSYFIIKVDQNTIKLATNASNAASSTAINLTSGAAGGSHTLNVKFDGVNTKFKATHTNGKKASISRAGQISLSINGVIQQPQDSSSPSVGYGVEADSTIVFSTAPVATDKVFATFIGEVAASFDITDNTVDNFTGNGSSTSFNLSKEVPSSQDVLVTIDGVTQYPSDESTTRSYSVVNQSLIFVSAPADGTAIQARHIGFAGATTSAVTGFYGRTGNTALISTDDISVQNISGVGATFTSNVNIEGVLTYEDVTNVDSIGIITARAGVLVGSGITLSKDGDGFFTGIVTATSFSGSGTNLTGIDTDLVSDTSPQLGGNLDVNTKNIVFGDSGSTSDDRLTFGAGTDLSIYHNGTNSLIQNNEGNLRIEAKTGELAINIVPDDGVAVYYDNSKKFETTNTGATLTGALNVAGGTSQSPVQSTTSNDFVAKFESSDGTARLIVQDSNSTANYNGVQVVGNSISLICNNETGIQCVGDGATKLYYDASNKLETRTDGVSIFNELSVGTSDIQSSSVASFVGGQYNQVNIADGSNSGWGLLLAQQQGTNSSSLYTYSTNSSTNKPCSVVNVNNDALHFGTNNTARFRIEHDGHVIPSSNNSYDLGSGGYRWRNLYTTDLQLSNKGKSNDVDGTWGDYTIQEGENDLFLINNRNGKKYKFNLTEVS